MIVLSLTIRQEDMKQKILSEFNVEFVKKEGIKFYFSSENENEVAVQIKNLVKNELGPAAFFNVTVAN